MAAVISAAVALHAAGMAARARTGAVQAKDTAADTAATDEVMAAATGEDRIGTAEAMGKAGPAGGGRLAMGEAGSRTEAGSTVPPMKYPPGSATKMPNADAGATRSAATMAKVRAAMPGRM